MSDRKQHELRSRLERAVSALARRANWEKSCPDYRKAITVTARWWAWMDARAGTGS